MNTQQDIFKIQEVHLSYRSNQQTYNQQQINSSKDAYDYLIKTYNEETIAMQEEFMAILLNRANKPLGVIKMSKGGVDSTVIDMKLLLAAALKSLASGIIISHNHPSGASRPSQADRSITSKIKDACKLMDISLLDHIIVTPFAEYFSFADEGIL